MASSRSITTNESQGRSVTLSWSQASQSIEKNTTTINWTLKGSGSGGGWVMSGGFKAVINGVTVYSTSTDARIQLYNGTTVASGSTTITHNADGTKSFSLSCEAGVYTYAVSVTASGTHTLNTIPRASSVSATNVAMGSASTITISRASSSFTHTLSYAFGSATGTIVSKTTSTSVSWTPALTLANQIPKAVSGKGTITCDTYSGSTKVGTKTCSITLSVPASVKPTISSLGVARVDGDVPSTWAIYVQSKSKATLTIKGAAGSYGSTISSYSISGGGFSSTASSFTTGFLTTSGTVTFTAKVTDSRGRVSDAKTVSISVVTYSAPSFTGVLSQRATSARAVDDDGTYIRGLISYSYASCSSKNTVTRETYYKKSSASTWTNASKSFTSGTAFTYGGGAISTESSYDVKYTITDAFTTVTFLDTVSTAAVLMDFKAGGKGIAIGKVAEKDKTVEIDSSWELEVHGKKLIDYIYPVGSIYLSVNATSPATLFGGSWTQLKDRFLVGTGTYANGATGGEATHVLTRAEQPSVVGQLQFRQVGTTNVVDVYGTSSTTPFSYTANGGAKWANQATQQANSTSTNKNAVIKFDNGGKGTAHNNLPPYLAVYMWKRTA